MLNSMNIPFNKTYLACKELFFVAESVRNGHLSGNGVLTPKDRIFFKSRCGFRSYFLAPFCKSNFYKDKHDGRILTNSNRYSDCLVRLPFYFELQNDSRDHVIESAKKVLEEICK